MTTLKNLIFLISFTAVSATTFAQEADIRQNLSVRLSNFPAIEEVRETVVKGIYEVRTVNHDIFYSDARGDHLFQGALLETKTLVNLTQKRIEDLTRVDFNKLPFRDSFKIVKGNGKRKIAVFEDPNCGYCKQFERGLTKIDDVTVHVFLYPILGLDSLAKSNAIWCSKSPGEAFISWMLDNKPPEAAPATCDTSAISRNIEFGKRHAVKGTPAIFFEDGSRVPGAIPPERVEELLKKSSAVLAR